MAITEGSYTPKTYNCNGSQTQFDFDWRILEEEDLVVKVWDSDGNPTTLSFSGGDFSAAKAGNDWKSGGTITTTETYASGYTLTIEREISRKQPADYIENDNFPAETHEAVLDRAVMIIQELEALIDRAVLAPAADPSLDFEIPTKDNRKSRYFFWNENGEPTAATITFSQSEEGVTITSFMETLLDDPDAATARATLDVLQDIDNVIQNNHIAEDAVEAQNISGVLGSGDLHLGGIPGDLDYIADGDCYRKVNGLYLYGDRVHLGYADGDLDDVKEGTTYNKVHSTYTDENGFIWQIREQGAGAWGLRCKIVEIGDWDMDTNQTKTVEYGTIYNGIRSVSVIIRNDNDDRRYDFGSNYNVPEGNDLIRYVYWDVNDIHLQHYPGDFFNGENFDSTGYNRGWILIWYHG